MRLRGPARNTARITPLEVRGFAVRFCGWFHGPQGNGTYPAFGLYLTEDSGPQTARDVVLDFDLAEAIMLREALDRAIYAAGHQVEQKAAIFDEARERASRRPPERQGLGGGTVALPKKEVKP